MLQVRGPSRAAGPTVRRSLPAQMSSRATPAPTRGKSASCAPCAISASCEATTWSSTPAVILTSSLPCWDATRAHPPLPAQPWPVRMVWGESFVAGAQKGHGGLKLTSNNQIHWLGVSIAVLYSKKKSAHNMYTSQHIAGCEVQVASSLLPHRWVTWPLSPCSTQLGLGVENVPNL